MLPMIRAVVLTLVAVSVLCSGCRNRVYRPFTPVGFYPKRYTDNSYTMNLLKRLQEICSPDEIAKCLKNPNREWRNEIIYARKKVIDIIYEEYTARLTGRKSLFDLGTGVAQAGLSAAGTLVPLADTKGILAAVSLGLTGTQSAVNKSIFYDKTVPLLEARMDADRKAKWKEIEGKLDLPATEAVAKADAKKAAAENEAAAKLAAAKADLEKAEQEKEAAAKAAAPKPTTAKPAAKAPQTSGNTPATGNQPAANQQPKYYGLLQALSDMEDYYTAGSLSNALMAIANPDQTDKNKPKSPGDNTDGNKAPAPKAPADNQ